MTTLADALAGWAGDAARRAASAPVGPQRVEVGRTTRTGDGVAWVRGLPGLALDEIVVFEGGVRGLAVDLAADEVGCMLLDAGALEAGAPARGTGSVVQVPVGRGLLGRVVDALGRPLDDLGPLRDTRPSPVERPSPGVLDRAPVTEPLVTGVIAVDAALPIGRGQRELILGDRVTGKTTLARDAMLAQRDSDVVCVYAAIGQKAAAVAGVVEALRRGGVLERSIVVVGAPDAPPGLQWLVPYAACSMAEAFRDEGGHALLVLDDLSKHALVHRQIALLLRQPPGREAYPGDIFYTHARLLERAARLAPALGGGSLTALPIAETQAGDLSGYVPTNLISITDGQLYLEPRLFNEGVRPAIDVGRSVSRVGSKSQPPALRGPSERLRLEYAQFLELELFSRFGGDLDERARAQLERGVRIRELLVQPAGLLVPTGVQVALLLAAAAGALDRLPRGRVAEVRTRAPAWLSDRAPGALARATRGDALEPDEQRALVEALRGLVEVVTGEGAAPQPGASRARELEAGARGGPPVSGPGSAARPDAPTGDVAARPASGPGGLRPADGAPS